MQYGRFVKVVSQQISQMMTFNMSWMMEHFYNATHGLAVLHTYGDICHQHTEYVARKYKDPIVVFNGYENMNTKGMTHQRRSKGKAGATVTVAANMTTTMNKDQILAKPKAAIYFHEPEKSNCKTYHEQACPSVCHSNKL